MTITLDHLHVNGIERTRKLFTPRRSSLFVSGFNGNEKKNSLDVT